jgi:hypothetical protein
LKRSDIKEGLVFFVPLRPAGYALGVVARHGRSAVTIGYFFGPATADVPKLPGELSPSDAVMVARFGDIPLVEGEWGALGILPSWQRDAWPAREFVRFDPSGAAYVVEYDGKNPNKVIGERVAVQLELSSLPEDALHGYVIVRNRLSQALCSNL